MKTKVMYLKRILLLMLVLICFGYLSGCDSKTKEIYVPEVKADIYMYMIKARLSAMKSKRKRMTYWMN